MGGDEFGIKLLSMIASELKRIVKNNKVFVGNVIGAFSIRGASMLLSLVSMPLYMRYFNDNQLLGVWFTMLTVLNWILNFDLGIGNGLRNNLTQALSLKNIEGAKACISTAYIMFGVIVTIIACAALLISNLVPWNEILNIPENVISGNQLQTGVNITLSGILLSFLLRLIYPIFYALQQSAIPNVLTFLGTVLQVLFLVFYIPGIDSGQNLITIAWVHVVAINIPAFLASIIVFGFLLKECKPSFLAYSKHYASKIFSLGIVFFFLQLLYMVISTTNEVFISHFYSPADVVEYQIYMRLFSIIGSLVALALIPVWSSVTKAYVEKRYGWILKLYRVLNYIALASILIQLSILPFLQYIVDFWLRDRSIEINHGYAFCFAIYSFLLIWISVQSSIVAGLGRLKVQFVCYIFATAFKILAIVLAAKLVPLWIFVMIISIVSLLPYCIIQPISIRKTLRSLSHA